MRISQTNLLTSVPSGSLVVPKLSLDGQWRDRSAQTTKPEASVYCSLIIPTYNERKNLAALIQHLSKLLDHATLGDYELIVVDDDSPDQTWKLEQSLTTQYPKLRVLRRQQERGLSTAVIRGWQIARGRVLGVIDGDLQHPPETLLDLCGAIAQGADLAVASRHIRGGGVSNWSLARRTLSRGAQLLGLLILPSVVGRVSDPMSGYFLVQRHAIAGCHLDPTGYKILIEVLGRGAIAQVAEVGYVFQERQAGESKVTWKQYVEYVLHLLKLRSSRQISTLRRQRHLPFSRFLRFGLVGFSGVLIDMAVLYLLSDPSTLAWGLARSKVLAAEVAILNNFLWNDLWTFRDISKQQKGWRPRIKRLLKFNTVCLIGLVLSVLLLHLFSNQLHLNRYLANLLAIAAVTLWNFWINLKLSWRVTQMK